MIYKQYFWRWNYNRHTIKWICHITNNYDKKILPQFTMIRSHQDWVGTWNSRSLSQDSKVMNGRKTLSSMGLESVALRSTSLSAEELHWLAFFRHSSILVKWFSGRSSILHGWGSNPASHRCIHPNNTSRTARLSAFLEKYVGAGIKPRTSGTQANSAKHHHHHDPLNIT